MADPVRYRVDLADRLQHLVRATLEVPDDLLDQRLRIALPTWTPGSYVIRNYVHDVQDAWATAAGDPITLVPDGNTAWLLDAPPTGPVEVTLELYANDLTVRTNHVDDHHALIIPPATFPWIEGAADRPHEVTFETDETVWSMLPTDGNIHRAENYLHLADSAFDVGDHPAVTWTNAGVEHRFVWTGRAGRPNLQQVADESQRIIDAAIELFGGDLPTDRYTFLCGAWHAGGGGLEHRDGSTLVVPAHSVGDTDGRARMASLIAHEYLHLWNVKRLTPAALVDPDLEQPAHTESLWVAEGWTSYYDELLPLRARVWTHDRWSNALSETVDAVIERPGRLRQTLRESSHQAWVKHYVRDHNSINAGTDYYRHGALVAFALDMRIRRSRPGHSLDDALRLLWERHGRSDEGYTEDDVEAAVAETAGEDLAGFFGRYVGGHELPDIDEAAETIGLERSPDTPERSPSLGVRVSDAAEGVRLDAVLRDGPAWRGGLSGEDVLVAIDGHRVSPGNLEAILATSAVGDEVTTHVLRGPNLLERVVMLGPPHSPVSFRWATHPSPAAQEEHLRWAGQPHPNAGQNEA